jgi:hypothetical protein
MHYIRANLPPLLVVLIGFGASLAMALAPFDFLYLHVIPDDSYYYFQIARNIVNGLGSTFDGVNLTNGYHPLWMLFLLPIFAYFSTPVVMDVAPIHAALVLSAVFNAGIGLVLLAIISRYTSNIWIKVLALAIWFFNPFNLYQMADGLETALSVLLIASFFLVALRYQDKRTWTALAIAGIVAGLMMLSRLDNVLYFIMFLAWLVYESGLYASVHKVLFVGTIASAVVAPWLLFNFFTFGMFFTSASAAYTIVNHAIIYQDNGGYSFFQQLKAVIYMTDYSLRQFVMPRTGAPSAFLILLGVTIGWLIYTQGKFRELSRNIPVELFLGAGFALIFIANASIRWSPREWYFVAFNFFLVVWIGWLLEKLRAGGKLNPRVVAAGVCVISALFFISWNKNFEDVGERPQVMQVTKWMNEYLPDGTIVGSFNAGIIGYFTSHRVINLDGLVNNAAYEAIRNKRVWDYIKSERIEYLADFGKRVDYRMKSVLGIKNVLNHLELVYEPPGGNPSVYLVKD